MEMLISFDDFLERVLSDSYDRIDLQEEISDELWDTGSVTVVKNGVSYIVRLDVVRLG